MCATDTHQHLPALAHVAVRLEAERAAPALLAWDHFLYLKEQPKGREGGDKI